MFLNRKVDDVEEEKKIPGDNENNDENKDSAEGDSHLT